MAEEKKTILNKAKFVVIKTGGKQYIVHEGETLNVELLDEDKNKKVVFSEVLFSKDNDKVKVGHPTLKNATVEASNLGEEKGEKQIIFKYKAKKNYRVKTGHRQHYTRIKIEKFNLE
jgi:large subunit ribosomal protein L21